MNFNTILNRIRGKQEPQPALTDKGLMEKHQGSIAKGFTSPVNPGNEYTTKLWESVGRINPFQQPGQVQGAQAPSPTPAPIRPYASPTPIQANVNAQQPRTFDVLERDILPITRQAGIHDAIAAGQWAGETRGQGYIAEPPYNNPFNINAVDGNESGAFQYADTQAGTQAYADLLNRKYAEALEQPGILEQLLAIQNSNYAGDPETYQQRASNNYPSYSAFIQDTPEFRYYSGR